MKLFDMDNEESVPLSTAGYFLPRHPSYDTLVKYCEEGKNGVVLESCWFTGHRLTSRESVVRFIQAVWPDRLSEIAERVKKDAEIFGASANSETD